MKSVINFLISNADSICVILLTFLYLLASIRISALKRTAKNLVDSNNRLITNMSELKDDIALLKIEGDNTDLSLDSLNKALIGVKNDLAKQKVEKAKKSSSSKEKADKKSAKNNYKK